jgi:hypothetical protein
MRAPYTKIETMKRLKVSEAGIRSLETAGLLAPVTNAGVTTYEATQVNAIALLLKIRSTDVAEKDSGKPEPGRTGQVEAGSEGREATE